MASEVPLHDYSKVGLKTPKDLPASLLDPDKDNEQKHWPFLKWEISIRNKQKVHGSGSIERIPMIVTYYLASSITPRFDDEIYIGTGNERTPDSVSLNHVTNHGYFRSDPDYHLRIYRGIKILDDGISTEFAKAAVDYVIMTNRDRLNTKIQGLKEQLGANELTELLYHDNF